MNRGRQTNNKNWYAMGMSPNNTVYEGRNAVLRKAPNVL